MTKRERNQDDITEAFESEVLGHTITPGKKEASIQIQAFIGSCPTVGETCTILEGEGKGIWLIKKVEILVDCLELTLDPKEI